MGCLTFKKIKKCSFFLFLCLPPGLLPCVQTNDLPHVCHTSEGAQTVRDSGPIYSDLWDPFATEELRLLSVRCCRLLIPILFSNVKHYILCEWIFPFHARKFRSFVGSRTRVLSFCSPMFFHCASRPRRSAALSQYHFWHFYFNYQLKFLQEFISFFLGTIFNWRHA